MGPIVEDAYVYVYGCARDIYTCLYTLQNVAAWGPLLKMCMYMCMNVRVTYIHIYTCLECCCMGPIVEDMYVHVYECAFDIHTYLYMPRILLHGAIVEDVYVHVYECACDIYTCLYTPQNLAAWDPWDPTRRTEVLVAVGGVWLCRASPNPGKSCHTYRSVMSHIWRSHGTYMNESCHPYRCDTYRDESCHVDR